VRTSAATALAAADGRIRPVIGQEYPLADAASAHAALESRIAVAKTLLSRPPLRRVGRLLPHLLSLSL
jgi:NADPH:quinone reductase